MAALKDLRDNSNAMVQIYRMSQKKIIVGSKNRGSSALRYIDDS
jgi:hypothetical protein